MVKLSTVITFTGGSFETLPEELDSAVAEEMRALGGTWHEETLPNHFETRATAAYGYQPRTKRYQIRKAKQKGHQKPLVWSGESRDALESRAMISADEKGVSVKMTAPAHWWKYRKDTALPIDKSEEVTRVSDSEEAAMAEKLGAGVAGRLNAEAGFVPPPTSIYL